MAREEEIRQEIDFQLAGSFGNYVEGYEEGFIEGAKWADEHPNPNGKELLYVAQKTAERTKKEVISKACEWLLHQEEMIGISFEDDFIERFKKAMEE
jgi:hypothetical protein